MISQYLGYQSDSVGRAFAKSNVWVWTTSIPDDGEASVKSEDGQQLLHAKAYYTINEIPTR
jgi:hypothetical protein